MSAPQNIVLIVVDSLRADAVLPMHLPATKRRAVQFTEARSAGCWTGPATASIFTGAYPHEHGLETRSRWMRTDVPTLAGLLADQGFATHQVTANGVTNIWGLNRGFQTVDKAWEQLPPIGWLDTLLLLAGRPLLRKALAQGNRIVLESELPSSKVWVRDTSRIVFDQAREVLRRNRSARRRSFLFLNLMEAHFPYHVNKGISFLSDGWLSELRELWALYRLVSEHAMHHPTMTIEPEMLSLLRARQRVAWARLSPRLDAFVAELAQAKDSLIIVCADHGDCFGEDDAAYHFVNVTDGGNRVPLFIIDPNEEPRLEETPISTRDLFGTILGQLGVHSAGLNLLREPEHSEVILQAHSKPNVHPSRKMDQICFVVDHQRYMMRGGWWFTSPIGAIGETEPAWELIGLDNPLPVRLHHHLHDFRNFCEVHPL